MIARIGNYMSKTDLDAEIGDEINRAIQYYSHHMFTFNQHEFDFSTEADQEAITFASASVSDMTMPSQMVMTRSANDTRVIDPTTIYEIREYNQSGTNDSSFPRAYAIWNDKIWFTPIPDASYSTVIYGLTVPPAISATASTNIFLTSAEVLIESRVRSVLFSEILRNPEAAAMAARREMEELEKLQSKLSVLQSSGCIKPWC